MQIPPSGAYYRRVGTYLLSSKQDEANGKQDPMNCPIRGMKHWTSTEFNRPNPTADIAKVPKNSPVAPLIALHECAELFWCIDVVDLSPEIIIRGPRSSTPEDLFHSW